MSASSPDIESGSLFRFDDYMQHCLYGQGGFYASSGRAGQRRGDFITSPEVGPLFGEVVANAIDSWWNELGTPGDFTVFDVGCGPGALLRSIQRARPDRPWTLIGVDVAPPGPASETDTRGTLEPIEILPALPDDIEGSVVLGNELLDNIPFRIVERSADGFNEIYVQVSVESNDAGSDSLTAVEVLRPVPQQAHKALAALGQLPKGTRVPLVNGAAEWVQSTLDRRPAHLCLFDYGAATTAELGLRGGWLRTYVQHERGDDPYRNPGRCDITTDIPTDQLPPPFEVSTQAGFLQRWGIAELVQEGRDHWKANAHAPDVAALKMRSRVSESEALMNSDGLGLWNVLEWKCD